MAFEQATPLVLKVALCMQKAMVFIDFENFDIAKNNYYKEKNLKDVQLAAQQQGQPIPTSAPINNPKLDFNTLPKEVINLLPTPHSLVKTFLFAPKPDDFLMGQAWRKSTYNWINGLKNQDYFTVIEGTHSARPVAGYTYDTMDITNPSSFYVEEKGTDVNLAAHLVTKGFLNAYDTAVIMSGDTDYIPVLDILNTMGKSIVVVGIQFQDCK